MSFIDLTEDEKILLLNNRKFIDDLITGKRNPTTDAQKHFILVASRKVVANTDFEIMFLKYLYENKSPNPESNASNIGDTEEMIPNESWGSREEWKQMRARWKDNR